MPKTKINIFNNYECASLVQEVQSRIFGQSERERMNFIKGNILGIEYRACYSLSKQLRFIYQARSFELTGDDCF
jgi:hypothetical protein